MAKYARYRKRRGLGRTLRRARRYRASGLGSFGYRVGRYMGRKISNLVHTFRKEFPLPQIVSTTADQNLAYQFTANTLPEFPNFIELYDQYKIAKIVLSFEPKYSGTNTSGIAPIQKWMRIVHDYDDANPLATEDQYLDYSNCKSRLCTQGRVIRMVLYPKVLKPAYILGGSFQTQPSKSGWLDTDSYTVPHLGLKVFVPDLGLPINYGMFNVRCTYVLKFKNSR